MDWGLFWFVAFCFVTTLIVLDNVEGIRAWFLSRSAKTPRRASASSADEFVRQAADASDIGAPRAKVTVSARSQTKAAPAMAHYPVVSEVPKSPKPTQLLWGQWLIELGGFLWKWKVPLLLLIGFVVVAVTISGCIPDWGKSKDTLRAERDAAESEVAVKDIVIDRNENISAIASEVAVLRAQISVLSNRGRDEIAAAAPENEAPVDSGTVAAFRSALDRLCVKRQDGSRADTCRPGSAPAV